MKIFTHKNVDLDAVCSVWAALTLMRHIAEQKPQVVFVPADWDGKEMEKGDIALDIEAGGRGNKGEQDEDGTIHSCFKWIVDTFASEIDQKALAPLVNFVDTQDAYGSAIEYLAPEASKEAKNTLSFTSVGAVFRGLQTELKSDDATVVTFMSAILSGMRKNGRKRQYAEEEANDDKKRIIMEGGKVAITKNTRYMATNQILFDKGVKVIIYADGNNIGATRHQDITLPMDHPDIRAIVEEANDSSDWFAHPAGFLYCWGSRKAPAKEPSNVDPQELARAFVKLLEEEPS